MDKQPAFNFRDGIHSHKINLKGTASQEKNVPTVPLKQSIYTKKCTYSIEDHRIVTKKLIFLAITPKFHFLKRTKLLHKVRTNFVEEDYDGYKKIHNVLLILMFLDLKTETREKRL